MLLKPLLGFFFPIIVEHLYMWPCVGAIHVWLLGYGRRGKPDKTFHSRFLDLRVSVCTEAPTGCSVAAPQRAQRFVHLLPQFSDNYAYLVVDAVEVALPGSQGAGRHERPDQLRWYADREERFRRLTDESSATCAETAVAKSLYFAALVDPSDTVALEVALDQIGELYYENRLSMQMVLTTHKHWDHQSGNTWLASKYGEKLAFYSGEQNVLARLGRANVGALLAHGDRVELRYTLVQGEVRRWGGGGGAGDGFRCETFEVVGS